MQNEKNYTATHATLPGTKKVPSVAGLWRRVPLPAKWIVMVPLVMVLLGAEIELHLAPQFDVIASVAGICAIWACFSGESSAKGER